MATEQNKVVVCRFMMEALTGRNLGIGDEVLASNAIQGIYIRYIRQEKLKWQSK